MKSEDFINIYNPYRGKYVKKVPTTYANDFFEENLEWRLFNNPLRSSIIQLALNSLETIAYFQRTFTNILGLDIDDHHGSAWVGGIASHYLYETYFSVAERIGFFPNILIQSPRGLHGYYVFDTRIPIKMMIDIAETRLSSLLRNKRVEILPTSTKALRIPQTKSFIHPSSFISIEPPISDDIDRTPINFMFEKSLKITISKETKNKNRVLFKNLTKIENIERKYVPIMNGNSNDALLYLGIVYRESGLPLNLAVERFITMIINKSPLYDGELINKPKRIRDRFSSIYKNKKSKKSIIPRCENHQYQLFDDMRIEKLMSIDFPFQKQREKPVRRFLSDLLIWAEWHDEIKKDPVMFTYFDFLYKWYRKNRNEGLYPLPSNWLKERNSHYTTIIAWLVKIGFLVPAQYQYSANLGICKYYWINWVLIEPNN